MEPGPGAESESVDAKVSKAEILRGFITERLTTAAREIFAVVERTVTGYEEEASGLRRELEEQRRQMDALLRPQLVPCRIGHDVMSASRWMVSLEGRVFYDQDQFPDFASALAMFFGCFYVFNLEYEESASTTLEMIQRYFVRINPDAGTKCTATSATSRRTGRVVARKVTSINSRVVTFFQQLSEFERGGDPADGRGRKPRDDGSGGSVWNLDAGLNDAPGLWPVSVGAGVREEAEPRTQGCNPAANPSVSESSDAAGSQEAEQNRWREPSHVPPDTGAESVTTPMRSLDPLIVVKSSFQVVERPRAFPRPAPPFHPPDSSREPTLPETVEPADEAGSTPCVRVRAEDHQQSVADTSTRGSDSVESKEADVASTSSGPQPDHDDDDDDDGGQALAECSEPASSPGISEDEQSPVGRFSATGPVPGSSGRDAASDRSRSGALTPASRQLRVCLLRDERICELTTTAAVSSQGFLGVAEERGGHDGGVDSTAAQGSSPDWDATRGQRVRRGRKSRPFNLRVCLMKHSKLKNKMLKSSIQVVKCPRGLNEDDFLARLRSTFPQLTAPFEVFTTDASRKLVPLKTRTLTPENIYRSIKSSGKGRSALYIQIQQQQSNERKHQDAASVSPTAATSVDSEEPPPGEDGALFSRMSKQVTLRVCLLKDNPGDVLKKSGVKSPMWKLTCLRGMDEARFLDHLRSVFPQLSGPFDTFTSDASRKLTPLRVKTLAPADIHEAIKSTGKGRSALYIRAQRRRSGAAATNGGSHSTCTDPVDAASGSEKRQMQTDDVTRVSTAQSEQSRAAVTGPEAADSPVTDTEGDDDEWTPDEDPASGGQTRRGPVRKLPEDEATSGSAGDETQTSLGPEENGDLQPDSRPQTREGGDDPPDSDDGETDGSDGDADWRPDQDEEEQGQSEADTCIIRKKRVYDRRRTCVKSPPQATADGIYSCKVCGCLCSSVSILVRHAWSHVGGPQQLCGVCGARADGAEELRRHLDGHLKTHRCDTCGHIFVTADGWRRHVALHAAEPRFKCSVCSRAFRTKHSLKCHQYTHTGAKPFRCDVCQRSFASRDKMEAHARMHTGVKRFRCDVCGKSFDYLRSLSLHKSIHGSQMCHSCQVCGKKFRELKFLQKHEVIHTSRDKTHLCHVCCKAFSSRTMLNAHLKTHSGDTVLCSLCGKSLSSVYALRRHMVIHSGERPYSCSTCGQAFSALSTLRGHQRTHSGEKRFVCRICGKACSRLAHLQIHMRTHNGERPYKCSICSKDFTQSHCLKSHMKRHQEGGAPAPAPADAPPASAGSD